MKKCFFLVSLLLINISAWGQTAASFSVTSVHVASTTLTDKNWESEIAKTISGMNEIAGMYNTGVIAYSVERLNSLEDQLLLKANTALSNEIIRRGETWAVCLDQMSMVNAPRCTRAYIFYFHCNSNGEINFLVYCFHKLW